MEKLTDNEIGSLRAALLGLTSRDLVDGPRLVTALDEVRSLRALARECVAALEMAQAETWEPHCVGGHDRCFEGADFDCPLCERRSPVDDALARARAAGITEAK